MWFVLFGLLGGIGIITSWVCQMNGKVGAASVAAFASVLVSLCGLWLDHERSFSFQFTQGLGLLVLPLHIFALTHRQKL